MRSLLSVRTEEKIISEVCGDGGGVRRRRRRRRWWWRGVKRSFGPDHQDHAERREKPPARAGRPNRFTGCQTQARTHMDSPINKVCENETNCFLTV